MPGTDHELHFAAITAKQLALRFKGEQPRAVNHLNEFIVSCRLQQALRPLVDECDDVHFLRLSHKALHEAGSRFR